MFGLKDLMALLDRWEVWQRVRETPERSTEGRPTSSCPRPSKSPGPRSTAIRSSGRLTASSPRAGAVHGTHPGGRGAPGMALLGMYSHGGPAGQGFGLIRAMITAAQAARPGGPSSETSP